MADQWSLRVDARTEIARLLLAWSDEALRMAGLLRSDLEAIVVAGDGAKQADREQRDELAEQMVKRGSRKEDGADIERREDALRDRLPLVTADLDRGGQPALARWLGHLSFARFRVRELAPKASDNPPSSDDASELKKVERVARGDLVSRYDGLDAFCQALLKPGREPVVASFTARGMDAAALQKLGEDAAAQAKLGRNVLAVTSATLREADAARAQGLAWNDARRAIRKACLGDATLSAKLAGT